MQPEGNLIEIAFELEPRGVNKRLILRVMRYLGPVEVGVAT